MNYTGPIFTLISLIIIFHIFLIKYFPQSKRFWKMVDYYWVSLGVIGIIGATFTLRKEYSIATSRFHQYSLENNYQLYLKDVSSQYNYYSDPKGFDYDNFPTQQKVRSFRAAGVFYDSLFTFAKRYKNSILEKHEFENLDTLIEMHQTFIDTTSDEDVKRYAGFHQFSLERLREEENELKIRQENSERGSLNWILLFISPYLFAIAIAIRLTKVTAELKDITK